MKAITKKYYLNKYLKLNFNEKFKMRFLDDKTPESSIQ